MEYFRAEVKVGAFILVALVLFVVAAIVVGDVGRWFAQKSHYTVVLPNANLLRPRAQVSYAGYPVGEVTAIRVRSPQERAARYPAYPVAVTIAVSSAVTLSAGTRVELKTDGFLGDRYLDLVPGAGQPLPPGGTLVGTLGGVEGMLAGLSGMSSGLNELQTALQKLLADPRQPYSLPATLAGIRRLVEALLPRLTTMAATSDELLRAVKREMTRTSRRAARTLEHLDATITENRPGLRRFLGRLSDSLGEIQQTVAALREILERNQTNVTLLLQRFQTFTERLQQRLEDTTGHLTTLLAQIETLVAQNDRNIYVSLENLRSLSDNLKATSELIRTNPAVLLWGNRHPDGATAPALSVSQTELLEDRGRIGRYDREQ